MATPFVPGPPELLPTRPDAIVDLQTDEGAAVVGARWRTIEARPVPVDFRSVGPDLGPSGPPNHALALGPTVAQVDDAPCEHLAPADTLRRLGSGRMCFVWYRVDVTLPERIGETPVRGATVVLEVVVDDAAEIWVDGALPLSLGSRSGQVAAGFNAPNRVVLTRAAEPGRTYAIAVLGVNGPISAAPANYVWIRSAALDVYRPERAAVSEPVPARVERLDDALDHALPREVDVHRVATGFEFTEGPVWSPDGELLFSSPNTNTVYRWAPEGRVDVFRVKSGYSGPDVGRYAQPGSNGLAFDRQGRLVLCQHGNRRVLRVEPRGNTTVVLDEYRGRRLNSPNDLVVSRAGVVYVTDPPFGLPGGFDDPKKELPFSGVYAVRTDAKGHGRVVDLVDDTLRGPNGVALSPDERWLYVGNWDPARKIVVRYPLDPDGRPTGPGMVLVDLTDAPGEDAVDGMTVDAEGRLYVCGPGGLWLLSPQGRRLGLLRLPEAPHNVAWGGDDLGDLYVTAMTSVYRLRPLVGGPTRRED